ncbi:adenylate/guanylate cyclase domain-containing protein [Ruegeria sp. HU-ET01832]|uniref:adenylate/guanylate cyclase domain-containing protein n=1 Tax=Ruegeria sp. HU-ET01832 TaxID=3135906 RepID=UPI001479C5C0
MSDKGQQLQRRLAAILAADVVGYSALMHQDEQATILMLDHLESDIVTPTIAGQSGRVVKSMGDGWLVQFDSAAQAVTAAMQLQEQLAEHSLMNMRIGVHVGDITEKGDDILGDGVNIAARLESIAPTGGIAISEPVHLNLEHTLADAFKAVGKKKLKNIQRSLDVWIHDGPHLGVSQSSPSFTETSLPKLSIHPVMCSDQRTELQEMAAALTSDFGSYFRTINWLNAAISSTEPSEGYALRGVLRGHGDRLRLEARLNDSSGSEIWTQKFDGSVEAIFDWQDEVVEKLLDAVSGILIQSLTAKLSALPEDELTAEQCVLMGMITWSEASIDSYEETLSYHARAIEAKPTLAAAYAEAIWTMNGARTYDLRRQLSSYYQNLPHWIEAGRHMAGQSPTLDLSIAVADYNVDGDADRLSVALEQIRQRAPLDARLHLFMGWGYNWAGFPEMALSCFQTALRLGRYGAVFVGASGGAATSCVMLGRDRDAIAYAEAGLRFSKNYAALHSTRAAAHAMLGEPEKASEALAQMLQMEPDETISKWRSNVDYGSSEGAERYFEALRRAGLPE